MNAQSIAAEQVRLLYTNAPAGFVATVVNAGVVTFILWQTVAPALILGWFGLVIVITLLRYALVRRYHRQAPTAEQIQPWRRRFSIGAGAAGVVWGAAGIVLFPHDSITHQVFLVFVLGGMAIGAVVALSSVRTVFVAFFLPAVLPITVQLFLQGTKIGRAHV